MLRGEGGVLLPTLPALILMDLNSHGVDGREALVAIKNDGDLKEIPMVVLTKAVPSRGFANGFRNASRASNAPSPTCCC